MSVCIKIFQGDCIYLDWTAAELMSVCWGLLETIIFSKMDIRKVMAQIIF
jgi:hypothetical protein